MTNPYFLTRKQATEAFEAFVLPGIKNAMINNDVNRKHLHIIALDPTVQYQDGKELPILFEYSIGNKSEWEQWDGKSFDDFARMKAMISWRTGKPSREVAHLYPHLLLRGDTSLYGSAIVGDVISSASGVEPYFDEMFSGMNSCAMIGEASHYAAKFAQQDDVPDILS